MGCNVKGGIDEHEWNEDTTLFKSPIQFSAQSVMYPTDCRFTLGDVEGWQWQCAQKRSGYWTIIIPFASQVTGCCGCNQEVVYRRINYSQKEFALLDKVVTNQMYSEP